MYLLAEIRKTGYWKHRPSRFELYHQIKNGPEPDKQNKAPLPISPVAICSVAYSAPEIQGQQGAESRNPSALCKQWNAVLGMISHQLHN